MDWWKKKSGKALAAVMILCVMLPLGSCGTPNEESQNTATEEETPQARAVEVEKTAKGDIQTVLDYSGTVMAYEMATVMGTMAGEVESVEFDVGDQVNAGDVLFRLDPSDVQSNVDVLEAQLEAVKAQVRSAQTAVELVNGASMQVQILNAESGLQQAKLAYENMQTSYSNSQKLYEAGVISKTDMDQAETGLENARIAYEQAQKSYDLMVNQMPEENLRQAQDALAAAQASQKATEAQLKTAKDALEDTAVTSPISGTVTLCGVSAGTLYSQSAGPAFIISDMTEVLFTVNVSEQIINSIQPGQQVPVLVSSVSAEPLEGTVKTVNPSAGQTGMYQIEIVLANSDGALKPGMFGKVSFVRERSEDTYVLPRSAVLSDGEEDYIFVEENGIARRVSIVTGIDNGESIEAVSGVEEGMNLIVTGQEFLEDGDAVTVTTPAEKEE